MKGNYLFIPAAALLMLAACSTDQDLGQNGASNAGNLGQTSTSGTVSFDNNTQLTIGNASVAKTRAAEFVNQGPAGAKIADNRGCALDMPAFDIAKDTVGASVVNVDVKSIGNIAGRNTKIAAGVTAGFNSSGDGKARAIWCDVFVEGTLNVNGSIDGGRNDETTGRIFVLPGGVLNLNHATIDDIKIYNLGGTVKMAGDYTITKKGVLMSDGDLNVDGTLDINGGTLYVGGNLNALAANLTDGATVHVVDAMITPGDVKVVASDICVEGLMQVATLRAQDDANVHSDCNIIATNANGSGLNVTDGATVALNHVSSHRVHLSAGTNGNPVKIMFVDGGMIESGHTTIGNHVTIGAYGNGRALLSATNNLWLEDRVSGKGILSDSIYVICHTIENSEVEGLSPRLEIAEGKLNSVVINEVDGVCNPGFTLKPAQPENVNVSDTIVLEIPDNIDENWFVEADDFAIRIDGVYQDIVATGNNGAKLNGVEITEDMLAVMLTGLGNIEKGREYTYETWLWVSDTSWGVDEATKENAVFTDAMKAEWISGDGNGTDITLDSKITGVKGYDVKYNVYRGLAGHADTPYIKVSIHVKKTEDGSTSVTPLTATGADNN